VTSEMDKAVNADTVKAWILDHGVDLVGIAGADNLILSHPPRPAKALMPTAKCVIVMAVAHTLGSVYAPDIMLWTRSKMQTSRLPGGGKLEKDQTEVNAAAKVRRQDLIPAYHRDTATVSDLNPHTKLEER